MRLSRFGEPRRMAATLALVRELLVVLRKQPTDNRREPPGVEQ